MIQVNIKKVGAVLGLIAIAAVANAASDNGSANVTVAAQNGKAAVAVDASKGAVSGGVKADTTGATGAHIDAKVGPVDVHVEHNSDGKGGTVDTATVGTKINF